MKQKCECLDLGLIADMDKTLYKSETLRLFCAALVGEFRIPNFAETDILDFLIILHRRLSLF